MRTLLAALHIVAFALCTANTARWVPDACISTSLVVSLGRNISAATAAPGTVFHGPLI